MLKPIGNLELRLRSGRRPVWCFYVRGLPCVRSCGRGVVVFRCAGRCYMAVSGLWPERRLQKKRSPGHNGCVGSPCGPPCGLGWLGEIQRFAIGRNPQVEALWSTGRNPQVEAPWWTGRLVEVFRSKPLGRSVCTRCGARAHMIPKLGTCSASVCGYDCVGPF